MQDPVMRVLTVLEILQARDSVSGAELARRLEVDLRTVQRYIVRLKDLSIPIDSTPGVGGDTNAAFEWLSRAYDARPTCSWNT